MLRHHQVAIIYELNKLIVNNPEPATKKYPKVDTRWPLVFGEVGVRDGDTSKVLLDIFPNMEYYAIDLWDKESPKQQSNYKKFRNRTGFARDRITEIHGYSYDVSGQVPNDSLDMCFIDADHHYASVLKDIIHYYDKVKPGGILCGHDIDDDKTPGVRQAVEKFGHSFSTNMGHTWFMRK